MEIIPFNSIYLAEAARLFGRGYERLRRAVPLLPETMADGEHVSALLANLFASRPGVMACENGRLLGFMGWLQADGFRNTTRRAAYCPEWAHAAQDGHKPAVYRALYRAASRLWAEAGCQVHAVSLLADDAEAEKTWFWNGFGLTVVDGVRPLAAVRPAQIPVIAGIEIRQVDPADIPGLVAIEAEHWQHYAQPPVFMVPSVGDDAGAFGRFLAAPKNSAWVACQGGEIQGYIRFEGSSFGAADIVNGEGTVAITGAYVRPQLRGRGVMVALMDAALEDYAGRGLERCAVDFESFNPEAATFWMKYFTPVCYSLMRVPEKTEI
jgi:ribosomal protein S18 acetylase RimI-like enzyme